MTFQEATQKSLRVKWKVALCNQGEKCWCRMIVPEEPIEDKDGNEIIIASSGDVRKEYAEHIVRLHNEALLWRHQRQGM